MSVAPRMNKRYHVTTWSVSADSLGTALMVGLVVGEDERVTWCLPARADQATLDRVVEDRGLADVGDARAAVAKDFGFVSWDAICAAIERRGILNARDVERARARIDGDRTWATSDLTGWCDHRCGAAPLNHMAMFRFDAPRLGLSGPLEGTDEMARLLLDAGAPVSGSPGEDETPLMTAASYGDADVARVFDRLSCLHPAQVNLFAAAGLAEYLTDVLEEQIGVRAALEVQHLDVHGPASQGSWRRWPGPSCGRSGRRGSRTPQAEEGPEGAGGPVHVRLRSRKAHQVPSAVRLKNRPRPRIDALASTWVGE